MTHGRAHAHIRVRVHALGRSRGRLVVRVRTRSCEPVVLPRLVRAPSRCQQLGQKRWRVLSRSPHLCRWVVCGRSVGKVRAFSSGAQPSAHTPAACRGRARGAHCAIAALPRPPDCVAALPCVPVPPALDCLLCVCRSSPPRGRGLFCLVRAGSISLAMRAVVRSDAVSWACDSS